jgi:hypothetical protein
MEHMRVIGIFDDEQALIHAVENLKEKQIEIDEVYSPYPVHEVLHLVGRKSRIPMAAYFYGLFGAIAVLAFLYWTSVISWPVNYGGKPFNSFPSFMVVTIVLTILTITIMSLLTFAWRAKLYPGRRVTLIDPRTTDDLFLIVVGEGGSSDENKQTSENVLKEAGAIEVYEKELNFEKA